MTPEIPHRRVQEVASSADHRTPGEGGLDRSLCLHQLFERVVKRAPDSVAVRFRETELSYSELNDRANRVAHHLRQLGVAPEVLVGLRVDRSLEMVVGILGILKAGGGYVPLDPRQPMVRTRVVLEDASVALVLTQESLASDLEDLPVPRLCLDSDFSEVKSHDRRDPPSNATPDDVAYVIYTSGSTGIPKGVVVTHHNVVRLFASTEGWFGFDEQDVWSQFHSPAFDFSVFEIWGALLYGGRLVVIPYEITRDPGALAKVLSSEGVTVLSQTPSSFRQLIPVVIDAPESERWNLRWVVFGGEALEIASLRPWVARFGDRAPQLINMYGITETTVHVTFRPLSRSEIEEGVSSRIGVPLPDLQVHLLDERQQRVAQGSAGEIYVGGAGVARGYLNRPDLDAERFLADPFATDPEAKLYRSGDRARELPDGDLEFLGRIDDQVQIRGFRVEPGEVESALRRGSGVAQAAVVARSDASGNPRLVAYVVSELGAAIDRSELMADAASRLPEYMLPSAVVQLAAMPLTANGKLDRTALPGLGRSRPDLGASYEEPRSSGEREMASLWQDLLGLESVGRADDFFELGGHSLLATLLVARVSEQFDIELPLATVFESPTLAALAEIVDKTVGTEVAELGPLKPEPRDGAIPLSASQERVWFLDQVYPWSRAYRSQATLTLRGDLDVKALERSLTKIVRRHESYRTTFHRLDDRPVQRIHPAQSVELPIVQLDGSEEALAEAMEQELDRDLDVSSLPLVRWTLFRVGAQEHVLLHSEHHLVHDGWSLNVFWRELAVLYAAFAAGRSSPLVEPRLQFADFSLWQRRWLESNEARSQAEYWRDNLAACPPETLLPFNRDRPAKTSFRGGVIRRDLSPELCRALRSLASSSGVTLFMTMLAAFVALLHRLSGQEDLCVGTGVANRRQPGSEALLGMIINNLVLRFDLGGDLSFVELLGRAREITLGAYANQDLPFDRVVEAVDPQRDPSRNPLFQVAFSFHDAPLPSLDFPGLDVDLVEILSNGSAKFDLNVIAVPVMEQGVGSGGEAGDESVRMYWEYGSDVFDRTTVENLIDQYTTLLEAVVEKPEALVSTLPLLTEDEREWLAAWNTTGREYPRDATIHSRFEEHARRRGEALALQLEETEVTYRELDERSNRLARWLQSKGVGREVAVGLFMERSVEVVIGILGILKAGGAYVPLDPDSPAERLTYLMSESDLGVILTQEGLLGRLPVSPASTLCLDSEWEQVAAQSAEAPNCAAKADDLAYVMYTSGSTGEPKGVGVPHRAIVRLISGMDCVDLGSDQTLLQLAPLSFDAATFEIWGALATGARLVLFPRASGSPTEIGEAIERHGVTTLWLTAPLFHQVVEERPEALSGVLQLVAGGDVLSASHIRRALEAHPGMKVVNGYGPTEATTFTCCHPMTKPAEVPDRVLIGRPLANTRVYVLDDRCNRVPRGVVGELWAGGDGLAKGYLNAPELTSERFTVDPFVAKPGARIYRTGDRVRLRFDGTVEYLGRTDRQVKIHGHRVEPGEVEAVLAGHPAIQTAVLRVREALADSKQLLAYLVLEAGAELSDRDLRRYVRSRLPSYMVPSVFTPLKALPLTSTGKVDLQALPEPAPSAARIDSKPRREPRSATEKALAEIWCEVLEIESVGAEDDFFDLGGHSLLAMRVASRIQSRLGVPVTLQSFFEAANIAELADVVDGTDRREVPPIEPTVRRRRAPGKDPRP